MQWLREKDKTEAGVHHGPDLRPFTDDLQMPK